MNPYSASVKGRGVSGKLEINSFAPISGLTNERCKFFKETKQNRHLMCLNHPFPVCIYFWTVNFLQDASF